MALREFKCKKCQYVFENIVSERDPHPSPCPKCGEKEAERLLSRFAVAGQGDLRESTMHGCHGPCNHKHH
jgi:putative FmdB family regulatory protein